MNKLNSLIICLLLLGACKESTSETNIKDKKADFVNAKDHQEPLSLNDNIKMLAAMTPATDEELLSWLPEEINGMERTSQRTGVLLLKVSSLEANYKGPEKKSLKITLTDGAGQTGSGIVPAKGLSFSNALEENSAQLKKNSIKRKGITALEEYYKNTKQSQIQFIHNNRYHMLITGNNMEIDELWKIIDYIDFDRLK